MIEIINTYAFTSYRGSLKWKCNLLKTTNQRNQICKKEMSELKRIVFFKENQ